MLMIIYVFLMLICLYCLIPLLFLNNILAPKKKDPKKQKREKELTFSLKTRQKRKHMTTVAGLELFGMI